MSYCIELLKENAHDKINSLKEAPKKKLRRYTFLNLFRRVFQQKEEDESGEGGRRKSVCECIPSFVVTTVPPTDVKLCRPVQLVLSELKANSRETIRRPCVLVIHTFLLPHEKRISEILMFAINSY